MIHLAAQANSLLKKCSPAAPGRVLRPKTRVSRLSSDFFNRLPNAVVRCPGPTAEAARHSVQAARQCLRSRRSVACAGHRLARISCTPGRAGEYPEAPNSRTPRPSAGQEPPRGQVEQVNPMTRRIYHYPIPLVFIALGLSLPLLTAFVGNDDGNTDASVAPPSKTVTDYDGNSYRTARIGTQVWRAENLKVTHYRDGTPIRNVSGNDEWPHATNGAYCLVEDNSTAYKDAYGLLYNFYAVDNDRRLCPEGWHVPSEAECMTLIDYLGGRTVAGGKIKDNTANLWKTKNTYATNESGFSGLPAGGRGRLGSAGDVGYYATWWSSTSSDSLYAWHWGLYPDKAGIRSNPGHKASGFSVRCVKDN